MIDAACILGFVQVNLHCLHQLLRNMSRMMLRIAFQPSKALSLQIPSNEENVNPQTKKIQVKNGSFYFGVFLMQVQ